jgi:serine/threonine protein kinase
MIHKPFFEVKKLIGEGLNAKVYYAESKSKEFGIKQPYAVKILKRKEDIKHFKKEFLVHSKVKSSSNVVKLCGFSTYNNKACLVFEYINGVTLDELLKSSSLNDKESNWVYHSALNGLSELAKYKVFHGDLSPKNIMLNLDGEIKLIDFGLSNWRAGYVEVTPEFYSEDVKRGLSTTHSDDVYALNKIFELSRLSYSKKPPTSAPDSLKLKIYDALNSDCKTQTLPLTSSKKPRFFKKMNLLAILLSTLTFLKPIYSQNYTPKTIKVFLRNAKWLSVSKSEDAFGCFTPCDLKFSKTGLHTIYWRSKNKNGRSLFYLEKSGQTINLSIR